jgi:hypothetical protein
MSALVPLPPPQPSSLSLDEFARLAPLDQALFLLADTYGFDLTPIATLRYKRALADLPDDLIARAADHLMATRERYMPNPAEIRAAVLSVATADERAGIEWRQGPLRSALAAGMLPANWDYDRYQTMCAALRVPEAPGAAEFYGGQDAGH